MLPQLSWSSVATVLELCTQNRNLESVTDSVHQGRGRGLEIHTLYTPKVARGMTSITIYGNFIPQYFDLNQLSCS